MWWTWKGVVLVSAGVLVVLVVIVAVLSDPPLERDPVPAGLAPAAPLAPPVQAPPPAAAAEPQPPAAPPPARAPGVVDHHQPAEFSGEALELLGLYRELLDFKDDRAFHHPPWELDRKGEPACFSQGATPYFEWAVRIEELGDRTGAALVYETGIVPGELRLLGLSYCHFEGGKPTTPGGSRPRWTSGG